MTQSVAFIDTRLADYSTLVAGIDASVTDIVLIDANEDGLARMAAYLSEHDGIEAIHVLGHGSSGRAQLGATTLTKDSLSLYENQLRDIGQHLSPDGDLLFYGCNIAEGENGRAIIERIAALTGADVAASTDLTGNAALGGDWVLEAQAGSVEAQSLSINSYSSSFIEPFAATTINQGTDTSLITYDLVAAGFGATVFQFTSIDRVLIVSTDTGSTGADIVFRAQGDFGTGEQAIVLLCYLN